MASLISVRGPIHPTHSPVCNTLRPTEPTSFAGTCNTEQYSNNSRKKTTDIHTRRWDNQARNVLRRSEKPTFALAQLKEALFCALAACLTAENAKCYVCGGVEVLGRLHADKGKLKAHFGGFTCQFQRTQFLPRSSRLIYLLPAPENSRILCRS